VARVVVALDLHEEVVAEAADGGAQAVVVHHPPIFDPITSLTSGPVLAAAEARIAVIAAHTNLDGARGGLNDLLCARLGVVGAEPIERAPLDLVKLVTFVPDEDLDAVRDAVFAAGAGRIGDYDRCDWHTMGTGTFRPLEGADPHIGAVGRDERASEWRLETVVPAGRVAAVVRSLIAAHPYEEPAFDLVPLASTAVREGIGRVAELPSPEPVAAFGRRAAAALGLPGVRLAGADEPDRPVRRVAVCTGAGGSLLDVAIASGAEAYVTGDLRYHDAERAHAAGVTLVDVPHGACEAAAMADWAPALRAALTGAGVEVAVSERWHDRWSWQPA
jgi:dinuclear metal center YbgI/SA1388 family protein